MRATPRLPAFFALLTLSTGAAATPQTALFEDDFESGIAAWTLTSQWSLVSAGQACPGKAAPFPSGTQAARFGSSTIGGSCNFGFSSGRLATAVPIAIPANVQGARLRFTSFEQTECIFGNCGWDERFVRLSNDGIQWTTAWVGGKEELWIEKQIDLSSHAGKDLWIAFDFEPVDLEANDYLGWLVDDVRVEVDVAGGPWIYCQAKLNSLGCLPFVSWAGDYSLGGADDLVVQCTNLRNNSLSKFIWSEAPFNLPFDGGTLCVAPPVTRTGVSSSLGTPPPLHDCTGSFIWNFSHAYLTQNSVAPGDTIYVQTSARDVGTTNNHSLSNAVAIPIMP